MVFHSLVLNLHQPAGNLEMLLDENPWTAKEILFALDRIPRSLWDYEDVGRVHLSLSGTLLETLSRPDFQARTYGIVKCGDLLWHLQNQRIIEILGTAYYHPVLPLISEADWEEQLARWQGLAKACPKNPEFSTYEHGEVWNGSVRDSGGCCGGQGCRFSGEFRGCGDTAFVTRHRGAGLSRQRLWAGLVLGLALRQTCEHPQVVS